MDFSINQFTFLLCHILFVIILVLFFSVLVVWTVHASFRVYFQVVTTAFFYVLLLVFLPGYRLCEALDSHCVTNTSCPSFSESHFTQSLYLSVTHLLQHTESVRFSPFFHSSVEKVLLVAVGRLCSTSWECSDKPVTRSHVCPAAPPGIAGRWPNLA